MVLDLLVKGCPQTIMFADVAPLKRIFGEVEEAKGF